ncbi:MerR family transcriptional regulator [Massiliimalia timonensis]|nr:MerR family transcriptional regulator [Clostridiales bacterium]
MCYTKVKEGENYYTIGEVAKMVEMTREPLRHYDRIKLVQP